MTPVTPTPAMALTARAFLFGTRHDAVDRLTQALYDHGVVARLGQALTRLSWRATRLVCRRLAETTADLVNVDLADMVAAGWQKYTALADAAGDTVDRPGSEKLVDLAGDRLSCVRRPQADVFVDDVLVGSVQFELKSEMVVGAVVARVSEGRLTAVESGRCRLSVSLSWLETTIAEREAEVELGAVLLDLEAGVPLVPVAHHPRLARQVDGAGSAERPAVGSASSVSGSPVPAPPAWRTMQPSSKHSPRQQVAGQRPDGH